ncbi:MAG: DUF1840 domain-containing protein [Rhodocyclaceae bacterium]|nr:DUF1840 domain-containing protein [Azospira sp.]HNN07381.1 DUF1840 domain-containing protein [Azospira sp.]HNN45241.1 DUF1840 domain-containing protein [Azospira sp.]
MLVKFDSNVAGEMLMFADVARRLLTLAGKECTARGVITREQIPEIVARLRQAANADRAAHAPADGDDENSNVVSLGQRAQPFIELLELTARESEGFVLWEAAKDFGE